MYTSIQQFVKSFSEEQKITLSLFKAIPNDALTIKMNDDVRSIQRLVWHILITHGEMLGKAGLTIECPDENTEPIDTMAKVSELYIISSKSVLEQIQKKWSDEDLNLVIDIYGERWTQGDVLAAFVKHEIHHRGQLSILMRLNQIKVPSIYGPSKEDWANYNMPAAE
jgi:uncharacterized damage-inducible protein DinB